MPCFHGNYCLLCVSYSIDTQFMSRTLFCAVWRLGDCENCDLYFAYLLRLLCLKHSENTTYNHMGSPGDKTTEA